MPIEIDFRGSAIEQARQLAKGLQEFRDHDLIPELRRELNATTKGARLRIRARIRSVLPHRGGLDKWVGRTPSMSSRIQPSQASVTLSLGFKERDFRQLDADGIARHPLMGNRKHWFATKLPAGPGFWGDAVEPEKPVIERRLEMAVGRAVQKAMSTYGP